MSLPGIFSDENYDAKKNHTKCKKKQPNIVSFSSRKHHAAKYSTFYSYIRFCVKICKQINRNLFCLTVTKCKINFTMYHIRYNRWLWRSKKISPKSIAISEYFIYPYLRQPTWVRFFINFKDQLVKQFKRKHNLHLLVYYHCS